MCNFTKNKKSIFNRKVTIKIGFIILFQFCINMISAQQQILIHSHNDYRQTVPFYQAYAQKVYSMEADIFCGDAIDALYVAHDRKELATAPTFDELYLNPLIAIFKQNNGRPWKESDDRLQLLIDLKTPTNPTLDILIKKLESYKYIFDPSINPYAVRVVISGNRPSPADFNKYPSFIFFDGLMNIEYTEQQLARIPLMSESFSKYSKWNGKGKMVSAEEKKVQSVIDNAHRLGKPIRFWGSPDGITAWNTLYKMKADYINTDHVEACSSFFKNFGQKNFSINNHYIDTDTVRTDRLDKTTSNFKGFDKNSQTLTKEIVVYKPSYRNDGSMGKVKNVILLIGDGMGLAEINAAEIVNKTLTMLQMKYIGLQKTQAKDAFTTDSAAAGSSIATGKSSNNRHIAMSDIGEIYPSLTDVLTDQGLACGVVTLGNIADATPAAFYGHSIERDDSDKITEWLLNGKLTLLCGSGMSVLTDRKQKLDIVPELEKQYKITNSINDINNTNSKVICLDERMGIATTQESINLLAKATTQAIEKLIKFSDKGFFLMVEGAKIDYAGHANSLPSSVMETFSFDLAVSEALKFADDNGETLIIVTADHETGGLTLIDGDKENGHITAQYMTDDHTPIMVPVFAYGPKAELFIGVYPNTDIFYKIIQSVK